MNTDWKESTLGEVCEKTETVNPLLNPDSEFDYIDVSSISNKTFSIEKTQRLKGKEAPSRARRLVKANDVLFATIRPTLQHIAIVPEELDNQVCSTGYYVLRAKPEIDHRFLFYSLFSKKFMEKMTTLQKGASYPAVTDGDMRAQFFLYPSLPEQHRIVAILDQAFDSIATARANAEKNRQNSRELFENLINTSDDENVLLGDLVNITTGRLDANAAIPDGMYPFFTCSREIYAINDFAFDCEAILLAGNNAVGDFNVKHYKGKFNAYQRTYVITVNEKNRIIYRYLYYQTVKSLKKFKEQSVGAGTKFLKLGMIQNMKIALPNLAKQEQIVALIDTLQKETQHLESIYEQKIAALDELKQALLHQAFNGEL